MRWLSAGSVLNIFLMEKWKNILQLSDENGQWFSHSFAVKEKFLKKFQTKPEVK